MAFIQSLTFPLLSPAGYNQVVNIFLREFTLDTRHSKDEPAFRIAVVSPRFHDASRGSGIRATAPAQWRQRWLRLLARPEVRQPANGNTVAVLPFVNLERAARSPSYGIALADAIASRLSQAGSLVVLCGNTHGESLRDTGQRLGAGKVVHGSFLRTERGFTISWQLLQVSPPVVISGGAIVINSFDLLNIRNNICDPLLTALHTP